MDYAFKIDGQIFNVRVLDIKRNFSVLDSDKSGRAMSGRMIRDIIGTFYNYSMSLDTNDLDKTAYDELYEIISAPTDYHVVEFPYAQEYVTQDMYITSGGDSLAATYDGNAWRGLSINFVAMEPLKIAGV